MTNTVTENPTRSTDWTVVWAATFAGISVAMQLGKVSVSLPFLRAEFGAGLVTLAVYISLLSIMAAVAGFVFGPVTRTMGVRRAGLVGLGLVTLGGAVGAEAGGMGVFMVSRLIEAFGYVLTVTAMPAVIQLATRGHDRSLALGIWAIWLPAGIAVMTGVAYFFVDDIGWRGLYRVAALFPALAALVLLGATRTQIAPRRVPSATTLRGTFRRNVVLSVLLFATTGSAVHILLAYLPTILVDDFHIRAADASILLFAGSVAIALANVGAGWLIKHGAGMRLLMFLSFLVIVAGSWVFFRTDASATLRMAMSVPIFLAVGITPAIIWIAIPRWARSEAEVPVITGLVFQGAGIGQLAGPFIAGLVVDRGGRWADAFWIIAVLFAVGAVQALALDERNPKGH